MHGLNCVECDAPLAVPDDDEELNLSDRYLKHLNGCLCQVCFVMLWVVSRNPYFQAEHIRWEQEQSHKRKMIRGN